MDIKAAVIARFGEPMKAFVLDDVMAGVVKAELDKFVKDSSNPYDDALSAVLWPLLDKAVRDQVDKLYAKIDPAP
jgi:hypothetical protein